jgi:hypothetical protein
VVSRLVNARSLEKDNSLRRQQAFGAEGVPSPAQASASDPTSFGVVKWNSACAEKGINSMNPEFYDAEKDLNRTDTFYHAVA